MHGEPLYAFKLGPIPTGDGPFTVFLGLAPDHAFPPIFTTRAADAMGALAAHGAGRPLVCEPALARAGKAFGFQPGAPPEWAVVGRAVLSFGLSLGNAGAALQGGPVFEFLHAAAAFVRASPWRFFMNGDRIDVDVSGALQGRFEASIMGAGGMEFGLALYEGKGTVARLASARTSTFPSWLQSIAVTMDDAPTSVMRALRDAVDLPGLPVPVRVRGGRPVPASADDLAILTVALRGVLQLDPLYREATASLAWGGLAANDRHRIDVSVRVSNEG
jgi:hypothetical protein